MTPPQRAKSFLFLTVLGFASLHAFFFVLAADKPAWPFPVVALVALTVGTGWTDSGRVSGRNLRDAGSVLGWSERRSSAVAVAIQGFALLLIASGAFYVATS